jgi:hypothetical protein
MNKNRKTIFVALEEPEWTKYIVIMIAIAIVVIIAMIVPDFAGDFTCFYQAGKEIASGHSPYSLECYYSPIWVALFFSPFSIFTREISYRIYAAILFGGYIFALWKISKQRIGITLIAIFSPFVYMTMQYGNIDWLVLFGLLFPKPIGIWFLLAKPQMGFTLVLLWAWVTYQQQGIKKLFMTFTPVVLGLLISYGLGMRMPYPEKLSRWSADIWPYGLLIGIPALIMSLRKKDDYLALAAAPFFTPYIGPML